MATSIIFIMKILIFLLVCATTTTTTTETIETTTDFIEEDVTEVSNDVAMETDRCVMRGHCGASPSDPSHTLNCLYEGVALPLETASVHTLELYC